MEMLKKTFPKIVILIILIAFLSSYYISNSGYYEYRLQEKTILTNKKIKEFESDIKENRNVDIKTYLETEEIDYSNNITNIMYQISNSGTKVVKKCLKTLFKKLNYLIED